MVQAGLGLAMVRLTLPLQCRVYSRVPPCRVLIFFTDLIFFYFMCINICAHLCAYPTHEPGAGRRQRKMSDLLELVL